MLIGNKKGQSAMEYLMTYGWALLVIVIVVGILAYIMSTFQAPQCIFSQPGFTCGTNYVLRSTQASSNKNVIFADITNGQQQSINVIGIACVKGTTAISGDVYSSGTTCSAAWAPFCMPAGKTLTLAQLQSFNTGSYTYDDNSAANPLKCTDNAGGAIVMQPGDSFNGHIYIAYKFTGDNPNVPPKVVSANLVTKAQ